MGILEQQFAPYLGFSSAGNQPSVLSLLPLLAQGATGNDTPTVPGFPPPGSMSTGFMRPAAPPPGSYADSFSGDGGAGNGPGPGPGSNDGAPGPSPDFSEGGFGFGGLPEAHFSGVADQPSNPGTTPESKSPNVGMTANMGAAWSTPGSFSTGISVPGVQTASQAPQAPPAPRSTPAPLGLPAAFGLPQNPTPANAVAAPDEGGNPNGTGGSTGTPAGNTGATSPDQDNTGGLGAGSTAPGSQAGQNSPTGLGVGGPAGGDNAAGGGGPGSSGGSPGSGSDGPSGGSNGAGGVGGNGPEGGNGVGGTGDSRLKGGYTGSDGRPGIKTPMGTYHEKEYVMDAQTTGLVGKQWMDRLRKIGRDKNMNPEQKKKALRKLGMQLGK